MSLPYVSADKRYGSVLANYANFFREIALEIDENPQAILNYAQHEVMDFLLSDQNSSAYERTVYYEALAYGDPGVLMACPSPSLSGLMLRELGTEEQQDYFFNYINTYKARTFFAVTEPNNGSNAGAMQAYLNIDKQKPGYYQLNGEKCLFGNGAVGEIGVVLARNSANPLGIRAVFITPDLLQAQQGWIKRHTLDMAGLRGAQIAYMQFKDCPIPESNILGNHKGAIQQGMMALIKTFNRLRTGVGALALGQAQAVLDYVYEHKTDWHPSEARHYRHLYYQLETVRQQLLYAAKEVDQDPFQSYSISIAKSQASQLAEAVISQSIDMLEPEIMLTNEWLAKCYRDCFAWEYMEGTTSMQLKNVFQGLNARMLG